MILFHRIMYAPIDQTCFMLPHLCFSSHKRPGYTEKRSFFCITEHVCTMDNEPDKAHSRLFNGVFEEYLEMD